MAIHNADLIADFLHNTSHLEECGRALLHTHNIGEIILQALQHRNRAVNLHNLEVVVQQDAQVRIRCQRLIELVDALLILCGIVIGRQCHRTGCTLGFGILRQRHRLPHIGAVAAGDDGNLVPNHVKCTVQNLLALIQAHCTAFTGTSTHDDGGIGLVQTVCQQVIQILGVAIVVKCTILFERSNANDANAFKRFTQFFRFHGIHVSSS